MIVLHVLELLALLRPVEQHVVPVGGVEVLDRFEFQPGRVDLAAQRRQLFDVHKLIRVAGQAPAVVCRSADCRSVVVPRLEIIDQVGHDVRSAGLPRELKVLAREHVPIEAKPELHAEHFFYRDRGGDPNQRPAARFAHHRRIH